MDSNSPPSQGLSANPVIDSAFASPTNVAGISSSPEGPEAAGSHPIEAHHATSMFKLPYPCCGSHEQRGVHNAPRPETAAQDCAKVAQKYDEGVCKDWKEGIDTLLVFAGLFSAVTTAFLIDSYKWLLSNAATTDSDTTFLPARLQKKINVFWFLSLTLALSAASTGMLCKQWLREYIRDSGRSSKDALCVRQLRLEGLSAWKVDGIISTIPLLLQIALILFFIGMLQLLWSLNTTVAIPFTIIAALTIFFLLFTTLAPSIQYCSVVLRRSLDLLPPQCPYKSPQSWLLVNLFNRIFCWIPSLRSQRFQKIFHRRSHFARPDLLGPQLAKRFQSWSKYDISWAKDDADADAVFIPGPTVEHYLGRSIAWLMRHFDAPDLQHSLYHLFWNSIQTYGQRTRVLLHAEKDSAQMHYRAEFLRKRTHVIKSSNLEMITSLSEYKSDDIISDAIERMDYGFRTSSLPPNTLTGAYIEWSLCSYHAGFKSQCNPDFTATSLLYLSGQNGLIGLQHCLRLIKSHLTHPDTHNYNFFIPPGVYLPFKAHLSAVAASAELSQVSGLAENLCDCATLLLRKVGSLHVAVDMEDLRNIHQYNIPSSDSTDIQHDSRFPDLLLFQAWIMAQSGVLYIPNLPPRTLPYLPQILRFLLQRASILRARSPYVGSLVTAMEQHLKEVLHPSSPGMTTPVRRDHIRAFINLTIQELHEPLTAEPTNACHLDLHSYPEIVPFIQRLRNLTSLLNVSEESAQWRDILQACGLAYTTSDSELLEEISEIPLPPEGPETDEGIPSAAVPYLRDRVLLDILQREWERLNAASLGENTVAEISQSSSQPWLNRIGRNRLRSLWSNSRRTDLESGTAADSISLTALPNATVAPVDSGGN